MEPLPAPAKPVLHTAQSGDGGELLMAQPGQVVHGQPDRELVVEEEGNASSPLVCRFRNRKDTSRSTRYSFYPRGPRCCCPPATSSASTRSDATRVDNKIHRADRLGGGRHKTMRSRDRGENPFGPVHDLGEGGIPEIGDD